MEPKDQAPESSAPQPTLPNSDLEIRLQGGGFSYRFNQKVLSDANMRIMLLRALSELQLRLTVVEASHAVLGQLFAAPAAPDAPPAEAPAAPDAPPAEAPAAADPVPDAPPPMRFPQGGN